MSTLHKNIVVIVGDIGTCKKLFPVVQELSKRGSSITWIVNPGGMAQRFLGKKRTPYFFDTNGMIESFKPDMVVIGTSVICYQSQIKWTRSFQGKCSVIWYEDVYATSSSIVAPLMHGARPDTIITIDRFDAETTRKIWINPCIIIGGNPAPVQKIVAVLEGYYNP